MKPRGIRNNNPGNIKYNGIAWRGLATPPSDGIFCVFNQPHDGIRALARLLKNYNRMYGLRTINSIITRFAPTSENKTAAYINSVARAMKRDPHELLDLDKPEIMLTLMQAIIRHENGVQPYTDNELQKGIMDA